ncbi:tetratricopeptide repeat protein [Carnimonas bestiolae]|uniref:tetratricopeptide repeat protein n=1 Tax=Carnimonas bestiolae TaxID=3402172 RepID=UPI003EDC2CFD
MTSKDQKAAQALHRLGRLHQSAGNHERALVLLLTASRLTPHEPTLLFHLADAFIANQQGARALHALERVEGPLRSASEYTLLKAKVLWQQGKLDEARRAFKDYRRQMHQQAATDAPTAITGDDPEWR